MRPRKGIIFISNVTKAAEHEWFCDSVDKTELDLEFVLFNSRGSALHQYIAEQGFRSSVHRLFKYLLPYYIIVYFFKLLFHRPHFVHCHLFEASLIGITAAWMAGVKKRIHTRHHGDFHHAYFPGAVKYDRLVNRLSTHIIAVSPAIKTLLTDREEVPGEKITVIRHGIPSGLLSANVSEDHVAALKKKYGYEGKHPVIGVISRLIEWKGVQYVIPAFRQVKEQYPGAHLVIANAEGDYKTPLLSLLRKEGISEVTFIPFEPQGFTLMRSFDVFVHVPVSSEAEAFGQVYLEAMALGVPMVCTLSGIARDLVKGEVNALTVPYRDSEAIAAGIMRLLGDQVLSDKLSLQAKHDVAGCTFGKKYAMIREIYMR